MQIHQSAEDYLETILMLSQRMGKVRSIDVVNELGFTKASVSIAMKKLRENGYIAVDGEGNLTLLDPGREIAERIYSRHRLLTHFFMQLGVDEKIAAEDACKAEHILSEQTLEKIREYFDVCEIEKAEIDAALEKNAAKKAYVLCAGSDKFYLLVLKDTEKAREALDALNPGKSDAYKNLDVTVLHSLILEKLFGIDKENMARQINLAYTRDKDEAIRLAGSADCNCAFLIHPTAVSEIKDVALAGEKMPQKSTYFYPKLITGLVMNELVPVEDI